MIIFTRSDFSVFLLIAVDFATSSESETDRRVPVSNILTRVGGTVNVKITKLYHYQRTTIDQKCQKNWTWKLIALGIRLKLATFYRIIKDRLIWVLLIRGEREFPFPSIPVKESLWFLFPNFGNEFFHPLAVREFWKCFFSFPSCSPTLGMVFFPFLPIPEFWDYNYPLPFPTSRKSFPLTLKIQAPGLFFRCPPPCLHCPIFVGW